MTNKTKIILGAIFILLFSVIGFKTNAAKLTEKYADKFFYTQYKNNRQFVYMVNKNGKKAKKLFSTANYIGNQEVVNNNKIGYYVYGSKDDKYYGYIYIYDLTTKKVKFLKTVKGFIMQLAWYDKNNYAYITEHQLPNLKFKWKLYVVSNKKAKKIKEWSGGVYGRGGWYEDADFMKFSFDGKKIMHISTGSVRDISDYNVYVFNRKGKLLAKIKNATQPTWVSNSSIVFRKYEKGYLYKYNLKTKKATKIKKIPKDSFNPQYMPANNKIAFWKGIKYPSVYTYDLTSKKLTKIKKGVVFPKWLDEGRLLVSAAKKCDPNKEMCPYSEKFGILNLKSKKFKILSNDLTKKYFTQYE